MNALQLLRNALPGRVRRALLWGALHGACCLVRAEHALTAAVLHCEATLRRRVQELTDAPAPWPALMPPGAGPTA